MQSFKANEKSNFANLPKLAKGLPIETIFLKVPELGVIKKELGRQTRYFYNNRLLNTSKWLSELSLSITNEEQLDSEFFKKYIKENTDHEYQMSIERKVIDEDKEDQLLYLKNLFDLREFKKTAYFALKMYDKDNFDNDTFFFYCYSIYLHELMKTEDQLVVKKKSAKKIKITREMEEVNNYLKLHHNKEELNDLNLFVYALILRQEGLDLEAADVLVKILNINPFFWSAWQELNKIIQSNEKLSDLTVLRKIKNHWMKNFFSITVLLENVRTHEKYENYCYDICCGLLAFFCNSSFLLSTLAVLFHNISDYQHSLEFFAKIFMVDPYRNEHLDILSNILYVKDMQNELGKLSLDCFDANKYLPETCCVLGNYHSLIGDHAKAAIYFKRAITLDRRFLAAYTLLGHEYLELKNVSAAIEAYNEAVQINQKDFRAWYGLGQAYELQTHLEFALYYFLQALKANPKDSRMWNAIGNCYKRMEKPEVSRYCLEKAEALKDAEGISLFQLGKMYDLLNQKKKAVQCFEQNLEKKDQTMIVDKETSETLLYLAYYYKFNGDNKTALAYASRLLDFNGFEQQEAQIIIQEIKTEN